MPLTSSWATVPVIGTYSDRTGAPLSGSIDFLAAEVVSVDGVLVVPILTTFSLVNGVLSGSLPVTADPGTQTYTVVERLTYSRNPYTIIAVYGGSSIDLTSGAIGSAPITVVPPAAISLVAGPAGPAGPVQSIAAADSTVVVAGTTLVPTVRANVGTTSGTVASGTTTAGLTTETARALAAEALLIPLTQKGATSGVATLDGTGKLTAGQLPAIAVNTVYTVASQAAMLALAANPGDMAVRSDTTPASTFILAASPPSTLGNWVQISIDASLVTSVAGRTGAVTLAVADVTGAAPLASPALTGTPTAPTKPPLTNNTDIATAAYTDLAVGVETTRATTAEALLAPKASPALTGTPTAPTQTPLTNNTDIATTAYADAATAVEKARALAAETLLAPKASPALTGTPTAPTQVPLTNNVDIATTAYADLAVGVETTRATAAEALLAPLASPALTGTPTAPTKPPLTNNTDISTTAYADLAVGVETARATAAEGTLGLKFTFNAIATNTTAASWNAYVCSASLTVTLPAAPANGDRVIVIRGNTNTALTIAPNTGQTIVGSAGSAIMSATGAAANQGYAEFVYEATNTNWQPSAVFKTDLSYSTNFAGQVRANAGLAIKGLFAFTSSAKVGNYTLTLTDSLVTFNGSSLTCTLPSVSTAVGLVYIIKNQNATALTLSGTVDGVVNPTLAQNCTMIFWSDGTLWNEIDGRTLAFEDGRYVQRANNGSDFSNGPSTRFNLRIPALQRAHAVSTANLALSGLQVIDGYTSIAGDIVLLVGQTSASQNGPWSVTAGAWARPSDFPAGGTSGAVPNLIHVVQGTVYANTFWAMTTDGSVTIDTTATAWAIVNKGFTERIVKITAATYTASPGDTIEADATSNAIAITLPIATGAQVTIKKMDATANLVTATPSSGTIDGDPSVRLLTQYVSAVVVGDGTNVVVKASYDAPNSARSKQTIFTASGTFNKDTRTQMVEVEGVGSGNGGGSGATVASGTACSGGAGGSGGGYFRRLIPAASIPTNLSVVIGAAGAGGTAVSAASTNGNSGGKAGDTFFGGTTGSTAGFGAYSVSNSTASAGGQSAATAASATSPAMILGSQGGTGNNGAAGGSGGNSSLTTGLPGAGGGAGGGVSVTPAAFAGGAGGTVFGAQVGASGGIGGAGGANTGVAGTSATASVVTGVPLPGAGAGGGGANIAGNGGAGGNGATYGGGGGGGGSVLNGSTSGAGGAGATGVIVVTEYF